MNNEVRRIQADSTPIEWIGDLRDDCTARWAGLILRAEEMEKKSWWWAVTDLSNGLEISSSNESKKIIEDGVSARFEAESAAKNYLNIK